LLDTAGWTPMLGLAGLMALGAGILLEMKRRLKGRAS
jgi:hypothetical protein